MIEAISFKPDKEKDGPVLNFYFNERGKVSMDIDGLSNMVVLGEEDISMLIDLLNKQATIR